MQKKSFMLLFLILSSCLSNTGSQLPKPSGINTPDFSQAPQENPALTNSSEEKPKPLLKITALNVGQGDATFIQFPNGKNLLIDAGRDGKGKEIILPFLKSQNIPQLDGILVTHYDADHLGGVDEVIRGLDDVSGTEDDLIPTEGVYDRGSSPLDSSPFFPAYLQAVETKRRTMKAGDILNFDPDITVKCLGAYGDFWNGFKADLNSPLLNGIENSASIVLLIEYGKFKYLTAGDLTGGGAPGGFQTLDVESSWVESLGKVNAVHVNHHGSATSSNETYVKTLQAQVALFQVGDQNEYHHPNQEVLERWKAVGADLWLTEKGSGGFIASENIVNGPIRLESDGVQFWVNGKKYVIP